MRIISCLAPTIVRRFRPGAPAGAVDAAAAQSRQRGQVLPLFVLISVVLLGGAALLTDVAWWWTTEQRMTRAADAGALAGAVFLPGRQQAAFDAALAETKKNGFEHGVNGVVVTPRRDPTNPRKLIVDIDAPVETFFARVFCVDGGPCLQTVDASVTGAGEFVLPVPMGSPENYYGVFGKLRTPGGGTTETSSQSDVTPALAPGGVVGSNWSPTSGTLGEAVRVVDGVYAETGADGRQQVFRDFGLLAAIPAPGPDQTVTIDGIEVLLDDAYVTGTCSDAYVEAHLSDNGSTFTGAPNPNTLNDSQPDLTTTPQDYVIGSPSDINAFPDTWTRSDFSDSTFLVRLTAQKNGGNCSGDQIRVDQLRVRVHYTVTTSVFIPDANIRDPYDRELRPQGLWGTFINQGAEKINGDAYLPKWDPRTWRDNAQYDPETYYNYALEIPAGGGGELWIYDPVFCATSGNGRYGTGDRWFSGSAATSAFYTLYDTNETPYVYDDDLEVASSGSLFANIRASDESLNGPNLGAAGESTDCEAGATSDPTDGRYWHNRWWKIADGLAPGTYRLHTRSTDPDSASAMDNANGHNSFSLWADATSGTPRIYGLSAMEAFTPLNGGGAATFFLAQIDAEHAGKTMVISLWDPGDTGNLSAELRILRPTASDYVETPFNYSAERVANGATSCEGYTGTDVPYVTTNTGGSSRFNGCWVTIEIPLPLDYDAPRPASETNPLVEGGWWKIRYVMGGSTSDNAFDLTTWQVELRGNPVHLVPE